MDKKRILILTATLGVVLLSGAVVFNYKDKLFPAKSVEPSSPSSPSDVRMAVDGPTYESIDDLVIKSKHIFVANITNFIDTTGEMIGEKIPSGISSHYDAKIEKELLGKINKQAVTISTLGGQYGGVNYLSPDAQNVEPGKRYTSRQS